MSVAFRKLMFSQLSEAGLREHYEAISRCGPEEVSEHFHDFREWASLMEDEFRKRGLAFKRIDLKELGASAS